MFDKKYLISLIKSPKSSNAILKTREAVKIWSTIMGGAVINMNG